jgi:hypothetical protein
MPILVRWDDDEHLNIHWTFAFPWMWNDLLGVIELEIFPMIDPVPYIVHHIVDISDSGLPRDTLYNMRRIASHIRTNPRGKGMVVFIGANTIIRGLATVFIRLYPHLSNETHFVDSLEAARTLIARRRVEMAQEKEKTNTL